MDRKKGKKITKHKFFNAKKIKECTKDLNVWLKERNGRMLMVVYSECPDGNCLGLTDLKTNEHFILEIKEQ